MEIIRSLDNKIVELITRKFHSSDENFKHRSFLTVLAIGVPHSVLTLHKDMAGTLSRLFIIGSVVFGVVVSVVAIYEWRYFFSLRRSGLNHDRNYFFEESAGKYRKLAFYVCFVALMMMELFNIGASKDLRYIFKTDFYFLVGLNILKDVLNVVVILELLRSFIPSAAAWSNRKHLILIISLSLLLSIVSTIGLVLRGHSIF